MDNRTRCYLIGLKDRSNLNIALNDKDVVYQMRGIFSESEWISLSLNGELPYFAGWSRSLARHRSVPCFSCTASTCLTASTVLLGRLASYEDHNIELDILL